MTKQYFLLSCFIFISIVVCAQSPDGGGHYESDRGECISERQRIENERVLEANRAFLLANGLLKHPKKTRNLSLGWPLQQAAGFDYCSYYGISNFVDHNAAYPNQVLDYDCGSRTYDLASGYNHGGVDIFLWPFDWNMVNDQQVEVIAAAPGVIVGKFDGNTDMNCDFSNPNWNAIYVEHADGSVAWYGHMKNGSLTNKTVGASVVMGEKLGLVASSGSSTGPHLHFELHDLGGNVIDPFAGACNVGGANQWANPKPYFDPTINVALTHSDPPVLNPCPNLHNTNKKDTFLAAEDIYFAGYFHDQLINSTATYTVKRPDNSVYATWTHVPPVYYAASYWYWKYTLPANPMYGNWNFSISMNGQTCNHPFVLKNPAATLLAENEQNAALFTITPNPANDFVRISAASEWVVVYDIQGKLLGTYHQQNRLDIRSLESGLYIVKSGTQFQKLLVKH
nr:peptidoglycan DD-metalloendopeptidase family protein [Chitinophagaceae bacterium]